MGTFQKKYKETNQPKNISTNTSQWKTYCYMKEWIHFKVKGV